MKRIFKYAMIMALLAAPVTVMAQMPVGGPGIAVAGSTSTSNLPGDARTFLDRNYPGVVVVRCDKEFFDNEYDVKLANGVTIEFDKKGKIVEIDAPGNGVLDPLVVKAILPDKSYSHLTRQGLASSVNEIKMSRKGYKVEVVGNGPDEIVYDVVGTFVEYDD